MVDGVFMVDGPSIIHGQKAINHKSWLMSRLREWLVVGLNSSIVGEGLPGIPPQFPNLSGGKIDFKDVDGTSIDHESWLMAPPSTTNHG